MVVVGRFDHHRVDAGQFRIHLGLAAMLEQPVAEGAAAGEIDGFHLRVGDEPLRVLPLGEDGQLHHVRVESLFGEQLAQHAYGERGGQDRIAVRFDDDGVAGGERREQARIGVPGGESATAYHHRRAASDDLIAFFHADRRILALGLFPQGGFGDTAHFVPSVSHCFQPAILRMRAARLESHHPALAGGVHHGVRQFEAAPVQTHEGFEQQAHPSFGAKFLPAVLRLACSGHQRLGLAHRIGDVQLHSIRRALRGDPLAGARLTFKGKPLAVEAEHGGFALFERRLPVNFGAGHFGERGPVATAGDRFERLFEQSLVFFEERMGHGASPSVIRVMLR